MEHLYELAMEQARIARDEGSIPVGAVVVSPEGEVVAVGRNRLITGDMTAHAEVDAIRAANAAVAEPRAWTLITTAEPCLMCLGAVLMCQIRTVVWLSDSFMGSAWSASVEGKYRPELMGRVTVVREPSEAYRRASRAILHEYYVRTGDNLNAARTVDD